MARKTMVQLLAEIVAAFPDNNAGAITPAALRSFLTDFVDSISPAYGAFSTTAGAVIPLTNTPSRLPFQAVVVAQLPEFTLSAPAQGQITRNDGEATNTITFQIDFAAANNSVVTFRVYKNGVGTSYTAVRTSTGANDIADINVEATVYDPNPATYEIRASIVPNGNITVNEALFIARADPVRTGL